MKNIIITGASGFIGSHLTELCVKKGYNVKVLIHYNSMNNWGWLENSPVKNDIKFVMGDIRDYDSVYGALKNCDTIFHLAALISIPYSYVSPKAYIETNIGGTYNVLHAARELCLSNILITSTSETYGTAQYVPINELHPLVGQSPYSATKIASDNLALSYYYSFELPIKIIRPFNCYGPRQSARPIVPSIITQILSGQNKIKLGSLSPTRDFTFVKDTVHGFLEVALTDSLLGQITNIGMNEEISIDNLVNLIKNIMNVDVEIVKDSTRIRPKNSEVQRLLCDNSKLMKYTNWKSKYNLETGLNETIEWMKKNIKYYKSDKYNL